MRPPHAAIAVSLAIVPTLGVLEYLSGRPPLCRCGRVALWAGTVNGPENSQMFADWYSLSHVVHGLLFYAMLAFAASRLPVAWRLAIATVVEAAWELIENSPQVIERYRAATIALGYSGDSILNSMSDVVAMMVGFAIAARAPTLLSVMLGITLELASLAAIRDNLALNILMLAHPVEAERRWQAGA